MECAGIAAGEHQRAVGKNLHSLDDVTCMLIAHRRHHGPMKAVRQLARYGNILAMTTGTTPSSVDVALHDLGMLAVTQWAGRKSACAYVTHGASLSVIPSEIDRLETVSASATCTSETPFVCFVCPYVCYMPRYGDRGRKETHIHVALNL